MLWWLPMVGVLRLGTLPLKDQEPKLSRMTLHSSADFWIDLDEITQANDCKHVWDLYWKQTSWTVTWGGLHKRTCVKCGTIEYLSKDPTMAEPVMVNKYPGYILMREDNYFYTVCTEPEDEMDGECGWKSDQSTAPHEATISARTHRITKHGAVFE